MANLCVYFLFLSVALQHSLCQNVVRTLLTDEPAATGAACLDGSSPGYYFRAGTGEGANKWLLHLIGGAWCINTTDCYNRSQTVLGSSTFWDESLPTFGMFSTDSTLNPDFYNWNVAYFIYCDGGSFAGNREDTEVYQNQTLYYRGYRNLQAIIRHLDESRGMSMATDVILTGCSAGGLGVFIHADFVQSLLSQSVTKYRAFPDAGFFVTTAGFFRFFAPVVVMTHNISEAFEPDCLARYPQESWRCFFGTYLYEFIDTPIFVLNSRIDSLILTDVVGLNCFPFDTSGDVCDDEEEAAFENYYAEFDREARPILSSPQTNGYFLESCLVHCHTVENDDYWSVYAINGTTIAQSFGNWYFDRNGNTRLKDCDWPCNPTCPAPESGAVKNVASHILVVLSIFSLAQVVGIV